MGPIVYPFLVTRPKLRTNRAISQQHQPAGCRQPPTSSAQETVTDAMLKPVTPEQVRAGRERRAVGGRSRQLVSGHRSG